MRYTDKSIPGFVTYQQSNLSDGQVGFTDTQAVYARTGGVTRSDIRKSRVNSQGWRPPTPYELDDTVVEYEEGFRTITTMNNSEGVLNPLSQEKWSGPCTWVGSYQPKEPAKFPELDGVYEQLVNKCLLKLRDQKINLALNMAELSKTARGVAELAQQVGSSYRSFRRGDFPGALRALGLTTRNRGRDAASTYLAIQYGLIPLMQDIVGGYEEATRETRRHGQRKRVVARWSGSSSVSESDLDVGLRGFSGNLAINIDATAQLVLWYEVTNPELLAASSIGLTNPMEILWELTPWSFIFDWFLPVGDYLGALTAHQGFTFLGGSYTTVFNQNNRRWITALPPSNTGSGTESYSCSGQRVTRAKQMVRTVAGPGNPPSAFLPSFKNPLSIQHAVNAVALLRQVR